MYVHGCDILPSLLPEPPSDSCEFGPCPNLDVTGIGQQIALGFAATTFAITVVHNTSEVRLAYYSYLANIYSLLISATTSISKGQLTRNDAVFVVVAIVSPGTLYLWVIAFMDLVKHSPRRIKNQVAIHEWRFFVFLSIFSFIFWVIILGLVIHPPGKLVFSQEACSLEYGQAEIINLSWSAVFLSRAVLAMFLLVFVPESYQDNNRSSKDGPNLTMWTSQFMRRSKFAGRPRSSHFFASVLFIMQLSNTSYFPVTSQGDGEWAYNFSSYLQIIQSSLLICIATLPVFGLIMLVRRKRYWPLIMVLGFGLTVLASFRAISILDLVNGVCWLLIAHYYHVSVGKWYVCASIIVTTLLSSLSAWDKSYTIPLFPQMGWFLLWRVYSFRQSASGWDTLTQLWSQTIDSAHVFKFFFLILTPTLAWAQSIVASNPTDSYNMTFGQIFALSIATLPSLSLAVVCWNNRREILRAIWMTDTNLKYLDSKGIPMHVRSPNTSRGALKFKYLFGGSSQSESSAVRFASSSSESTTKT